MVGWTDQTKFNFPSTRSVFSVSSCVSHAVALLWWLDLFFSFCLVSKKLSVIRNQRRLNDRRGAKSGEKADYKLRGGKKLGQRFICKIYSRNIFRSTGFAVSSHMFCWEYDRMFTFSKKSKIKSSLAVKTISEERGTKLSNSHQVILFFCKNPTGLQF